MKNIFCTISTSSHLYRVIVLLHSIQKFQPTASLYCLVVDDSPASIFPSISGLNWVFREDVEKNTRAAEMFGKYPAASDNLRWALKPSFMLYLLTTKQGQNIFYCDSDLYFVSDFSFFDEHLKESHILLSPHFRISDPEIDGPWFTTNFKDGIFNGGFIGASPMAESELKWWEKATAFACEINFAEGRYVDQKYLDMMPALFEKIAILRHKGCNVAYWNRHECIRTSTNGTVWINLAWPVVFIHFTKDLIQAVQTGEDPCLIHYLDEYKQQILIANTILTETTASR